MDVDIKIVKEQSPKDLILVVGLPGIAYIGKLSVDYLVKQLKAELIGEVYSRYFPPYVVIKEDGLVELLKNELYLHKGENGQDFVFFTGNAQAFSPEGQYEIANRILDWATQHGVKQVFSVAALVTDKPFETPKVQCTATSKDLLEELKKHDVSPLESGIIGGENGLILGLARKKGLEGACLLAETHGYQLSTGEYVTDAKAAKAALHVVEALLQLKLDMEPMDKQAKQMDEVVAKMAEIERRVREEMTQSSKKPSYVT